MVISGLVGLAWLTASTYFYPGFILDEQNWLGRNRNYFVLGAIYFWAWSGFNFFNTNYPWVGTAIVYVAGIVLYKDSELNNLCNGNGTVIPLGQEIIKNNT